MDYSSDLTGHGHVDEIRSLGSLHRLHFVRSAYNEQARSEMLTKIPGASSMQLAKILLTKRLDDEYDGE